MRRMIKVAIAEDHSFVREGLAELINKNPKTRVTIQASNGLELLNAMKEDQPDVILLDLEMPIVDGRQALQEIVVKYPEVKVMMLSMHTQMDIIADCIGKGANGFLTKGADIEKIYDAIDAVLYKGFYFDDIVTKSLVASIQLEKKFPSITLDDKDVRIIELICKGKTSKEIGIDVCLGERTVEGRRLKIHKKTNTNNLAELVVYAIKYKIFVVY